VRQLTIVLMALLIPTAAMAKDECNTDIEKFCKAVVDAKGDVGDCLDQHKTELSAPCKTKREKNFAKGKSKGTQSNAPTPKSDTTKP
jgi:cysteine rich repeat protein